MLVVCYQTSAAAHRSSSVRRICFVAHGTVPWPTRHMRKPLALPNWCLIFGGRCRVRLCEASWKPPYPLCPSRQHWRLSCAVGCPQSSQWTKSSACHNIPHPKPACKPQGMGNWQPSVNPPPSPCRVCCQLPRQLSSP